ncbi:Ubiquitin carboxyl-terminal hydrolase 2 [Amphibalanus amphitrite]|uniref:ubiquitinyl hydrolase 1 n=1 Tax=Amphibalanus amphitrite TaxID=1232801 RepID=A0A6A4VBU5_AMPAM|nr:Ubiquitin carboxyl-terminal hydrolase 2 [Amphibalanus amphitrite]
MPPGSSAGLDGIRPLHLRQLLSRETAESGRRLLSSLTALTNLVLRGLVPECGRDALFGASLCALRKKDGGLRPIAVGSVFRRLPGRIAARHIADIIGPELRPTQLGVGTPLGCEAAVHAVREFISSDSTSSDTPRVMVKIDVRNAFNTIRRDVILARIHERCPEVYPLAYQAYHLPTPLHIGDQTVLSATGVQQGDPLGPAAFALGVDACARAIRSPLNVWYLDDATIAGPADVVQSDLHSLAKALTELGLQLNPAKCEVAIIDAAPQLARNAAVDSIRSVLPEITEIPLHSVTLLGAPLLDASLTAAANGAAELIGRLCTRLTHLDRHTGLFFLVHYASAPRLQYLLRSAPLYKVVPALKLVDELVRETLVDITNVNINDQLWEQAKLPFRLGGLGVRSVEDLALPCYISSLHAALPLLRSISPGLLPVSGVPPTLQTAIHRFSEVTGTEQLPPASAASSQRAWDTLSATAIRDKMVNSANQLHRARLVAASQPHTAAWLQAVPVPSLGLHLDEESVRVAVALRLGATVCEQHRCRLCGRQVDQLGHHGLSCVKSAGRLPRHAQLNDVVRRGLASAGIPSILEPVGLDRGDGKRPDGLTLFPYSGGMCLTWDATCADTFADTVLIQTALEPGAAARAAEDRKRRHYSEISSRFKFVPIAVETSGVLGPATSKFIRELGQLITTRTGERRETEWLLQRLSIAVVRGNAAAVLATAATDRARADRRQQPPPDVTGVRTRPSPPPSATTGRASAKQTARQASPEFLADEPLALPSEEASAPPNTRLSHHSLPGNPSEDGGGTGSESDGRPLGLTGLRNTGNTCFLNTVVQCLSNTRALHDYILRDGRSSDASMPAAATKGSLMNTFSALIRDMWTSSDETERVLTTAPLKSMIQRLAPRFMGSQQQDAQEFLRYLLQGLHEDVNRVTSRPKPITTDIDDSLSASQKSMEAWKRFLRLENSKFVDLFVGQLKATLRCTVCGHASVTFDPFWDLSLPIPSRSGQVRLQACFDLFTKEEVLDGDEKTTCSKCQTRQKCTRSLSIQKFPRILVVHLKRFSPQERFRGKLNTTVDFSVNGLDLSPYSAGQTPCRYSLYGVANHSGTLLSGHYTAHCRHPYTAEWYEYNDSRVHVMDQRNVNSGKAYVLFFELAGSKHRSGSTHV